MSTEPVIPNVVTRFKDNIIVDTPTRKKWYTPGRMHVFEAKREGQNLVITVSTLAGAEIMRAELFFFLRNLHGLLQLATTLAEERFPKEEPLPDNRNISGT